MLFELSGVPAKRIGVPPDNLMDLTLDILFLACISDLCLRPEHRSQLVAKTALKGRKKDNWMVTKLKLIRTGSSKLSKVGYTHS